MYYVRLRMHARMYVSVIVQTTVCTVVYIQSSVHIYTCMLIKWVLYAENDGRCANLYAIDK